MIFLLPTLISLGVIQVVLHYQIREFLIEKNIESGSWWYSTQYYVNLQRYYRYCKSNNISLMRFYLSIFVQIMFLGVIIFVVCV